MYKHGIINVKKPYKVVVKQQYRIPKSCTMKYAQFNCRTSLASMQFSRQDREIKTWSKAEATPIHSKRWECTFVWLGNMAYEWKDDEKEWWIVHQVSAQDI